MFNLKGIFAGLGAVAGLYVAAFLFMFIASSRPNVATGVGALLGGAIELLFHPAFLLAAVVAFLTAAYWANK